MNTEPASSPEPSLSPLVVAAVVTSLAAAASHGLPDIWAANAVATIFFLATYWLVLRRDTQTIAAHGLSLGGVFEPAALQPGRLWSELLGALRWTLIAGLIVFPPFVLGYIAWWNPTAHFQLNWGPNPIDEVATQVLAIALPEEMFYRGYLQSRLERRWPPRRLWWGGNVGTGVIVTSLIFALGHVLTVPHPARLSVFFPSLLFGWLRSRTNGIGASVLLHAASNLLALNLGRGYGLFD